MQITAKKNVEIYKNLAKKKAPLPFHITDLAGNETVNYINDTNLNDVLSNKSAQITSKKLLKNTEIWQGKNHSKDLPKNQALMLFF